MCRIYKTEGTVSSMSELTQIRAALEILSEQLALQQKQLTAQTKQLAVQQSQLSQKDQRIEELTQMLRNLQRAHFGQHSEKNVYVLGDGARQLSIFDMEGDSSAAQDVSAISKIADEEETGEIAVSAHGRKRKRTLDELFAQLPVEEVVMELPEEERTGADGKALVCIGREFVRRELVMERAKLKAVKIYRKVYADRALEMETGETVVFKPEVPAPLLPHSYVTASVAADVLVKKYADGLPLYRQEQQWKRMGVPLSRGTMANWMIRLSGFYFLPLWKRLHEMLLEQNIIHADETVLQVLKEEGRAPTSQSRMWVYASAPHAPEQLRLFEYRDSRKGECAQEFLSGFHGILVSDGYSGYYKVDGVVRAGCWAHMRRRWRDAMPPGEMGKKSIAAQGYAYCNRLFALERKYAHLTDEERLLKRQEKSRPLLDAYWSWVESIPAPSGKLKDAVTYARSQRTALSTFLEHGEVELSNNPVENAIRPFVVGRKGWLFSDTSDGAKASALIYSLLETAKANSLRLEDYVLYLLKILPERFAEDTNAGIDDLLPCAADIRERFGITGTRDY